MDGTNGMREGWDKWDNKGWMGQMGQRGRDGTNNKKSRDSWVWTKSYVLSSSYNVDTLFFSKYTKEVFNMQRALHSPKYFCTMVYHPAFYITIRQLPIDRASLSDNWGHSE